MAERSLSFENALQDLGTWLHRIALLQTIPDAVSEDDPDRMHHVELAAAFSAEDIQLFYQIVIQGRHEIGFAPDEYAGFTMTLMRMLAFRPGGGAASAHRAAGDGARPATPDGAARPEHATPRQEREVKKKSGIEGDWAAFASGLPLAGMERMLAHNCELVAWRDGKLELRVAHAQRHLNNRAYLERLQQSLEQHIGEKIRLEISVGEVDGKTVAAARDREQKQQLSAAAKAIDGDPFVRDVIENFGARVDPASVKPMPQEGT
jgi:DNA polymerase-3 subunit gamma/tau